MNTKNALFLFVFVLIVVGLFISFVYLYGRNTGDNTQGISIVGDDIEKGNEKSDNLENKEDLQDNLAIVDAEVVEIIKEDFNIQAILPPVPDLDRPIIVPDSFSLTKREELTEQIKNISSFLKQDADLFNQWMDLGILRKIIKDYEGAREIWEYAGAIRPQNAISFTNLGNLYGYYLQNPSEAEKNYLKSIENSPKLVDLYVRTAFFYFEVLKDRERAGVILRMGLEELPFDESLKNTLEFIES